MASHHHNYGHFTSSAPSSHSRLAPQPYATQGQSHAVSLPTSRFPSRKKSVDPTSTLVGTPQYDGVSRSRQAPAPLLSGSIVWLKVSPGHLARRLRMDSKRAEIISQQRFLVLVDSVGPQNEITFLFLYHRAPAATGETGLPRALRPQPHHSVVLNPTAQHSRACVVPSLRARDMHIWTAPPMTVLPVDVYPGSRSIVAVGDPLYDIRHYAQADLHEQDAVWSKAAYNDGRLHTVTSDYSREAHVSVWTDINAYTLQSAADPSVVLGLLYQGR